MDTTSSSAPRPLPAIPAARPDWRDIASTAVTEHRAIQHSAELAMLLTLADMIQARTILELGTFAAGTTWALAQLPSAQRIITVDYSPQAEAYRKLGDLGQRAVLVQGDTADLATAGLVRQALDGHMPDLLFIDGAHDLAAVTEDWRIYGPMCSPGGIVAFHDVEQHHNQPDVQVHLLWDQIRNAYPSFKISAAPGQWAGLGIVWR